ncbi:MAG TPA: hypothetical protein PKE55_05745 [Kiritimatiellia bacterium]|nr:hypothetical protein [Kiritimatiellia bacterium]
MRFRRGLGLLALAWGLLLTGRSEGQVTVGLRLNFNTFILHEPIEAVVTLRNETSRDIPLGGEGGLRVGFQVTESGGRSLAARRSMEGVFPPVLPAQGMVSVTNLLSRFHDIRAQGQYTALARAEWGQTAFLSRPVFFDVVPGVEIQRMVVPLPDEEGERTFMLRTVNRGRAEHLLIRVDDELNRLCYAVIDLGRMANRAPPEMKIDSAGQAHVLFQSSPGQHVYAVCAPDGFLADRQVFGRDFRRASLAVDDVGTIFVRGAPEEPGPPMLRGQNEGMPVRRSAP